MTGAALAVYSFGVAMLFIGLGIVIGVGQRVFLQRVTRYRPHRSHLGCCRLPLRAASVPARARKRPGAAQTMPLRLL